MTLPKHHREDNGPWDIAARTVTPAFEFGRAVGGVREVYYAGEPWQGRPTRVFAYYGVPAVSDAHGASVSPAPAMMLVHGGGGKAFAEWVRLWTARGYAALSLDWRGQGPDAVRMADGGPEHSNGNIFHRALGDLRETWPYHAVAAVLRGVSVLAAQPEVDARRIGLTGISWGGYLTSLVAGLDPRPRFAVPVYGCGFLHHDSVWLPILNQLTAAERECWVEHFDPSSHLPNARLPMLWVTGTNDFAYPLDSLRESYRAAPGPRTLCVTVRMPHGHAPGWAPKEIGLYADQHLLGATPLPCMDTMRIDGNRVVADFASETPIVDAGLHFTADTGPWPDRRWESLPARIEAGRVTAALPAARPLVCFMTVADDRAATVSTEHEELAP